MRRLPYLSRAPYPCVSLALAIASLTSACTEAKPKAVAAQPAGCVLVLNERPILVDEVDRIGSIVAKADPTAAVAQLRRYALTNEIFQRIAAETIDVEACARARAVATHCAQRLAQGEALGPPLPALEPKTKAGGFQDLGLELWDWALDAEVGRWSHVLAAPGAYLVARLDERSKGSFPREVWISATVYTISWLEPERLSGDIEKALDRAQLEIVDASWRDLVPTHWLKRFRVGPP